MLPATGAETEARRRIAERGAITFAEFMEVALYWPEGGYYASRRAFGPAGDFYTAPLAHPVFGALIARQLRTMRDALGRPAPFRVHEDGAGDATLAADAAAHAPLIDADFGAALRYHAHDRAARDPEQAAPLPADGAAHVVLANELLDAMPVHRVTIEDGALREICVTIGADGRLAETTRAPSTPALAERLAAVGARLSEGFRAEVCLAAAGWVASAYAAIGSGYLLLIDYGHEAADYYAESRRMGTLRCYEGHTLGMDPYANVGRRDISVHVELTSLRAAALAAGFADAGAASQAELLRGLGLDAYRRDLAERPGLSAAGRSANLRLLATLEDAEGMGAFRALCFAKDAPRDNILGAATGAAGPAPLPSARHMPAGPPEAQPLPTWEELLR